MGNAGRFYHACAFAALAGLSAPAIGQVSRQMITADFQGVSPKEVAARMVSACIERQWPIISQSETQVVCENEADELGQLAWMTSRPRAASNPRGFLHVTIAAREGGAVIQAYGYSEFSTVFGQMKQIPANTKKEAADIITRIGGTILPKR